MTVHFLLSSIHLLASLKQKNHNVLEEGGENMDDNNTNDDNPSHIAVKQIQQTVNRSDEIRKDEIVDDAGDSDGEYSSLGSSGPEDEPEGDIDAGGVMDIDKARAAMGESNDGDGEFRRELSDDDLNTNAIDDVSTPRPNREDELEETE